MKLIALLVKDGRILARNRPLLAALIIYPFLLAGVLAAAFQEPPSTLALVVVDEDRSGPVLLLGENRTSEDFLATATSFATIQRASTLDEGLSILRRGEADALLHLTNGFMRNLSTLGTSATLRLVVDESDPVRASVARNAVEGAVEAFVSDIINKKIEEIVVLLDTVVEGGGVRIGVVNTEIIGIEEARRRLTEVENALPPGSPERAKVSEVIDFMITTQLALGGAEQFINSTAKPLTVEAEGLAAKDTRVTAIALPGALVLGVFWTGALSAALVAARERETGVHRRMLSSPAPRWLQLFSKMLVALAAALVPAGILVLLGVGALGVRIVDPPLTAAVIILASLAAAALGALCAAIARATSGAALLAVLLLLPMLLLGGLFYPVAYMPEGAQVVSRAMPVTMATDALRGVLLRGSTFAELTFSLLGLGLFALAAGGAGAWLSRRPG